MIDEATTFVIGGQSVEVPPMVFYCLERAWPHIRSFHTPTEDAIAVSNEAIGIFCAATALFDPPWTPNDVKMRLTWTETPAFIAAIGTLLGRTGLLPGELRPADANGAAPPSQTGQPSSQNSSPAASKAEAGMLSSAA